MEKIFFLALFGLLIHLATSSVLNTNGAIKNALPATDTKQTDYYTNPQSSEHVYKYNNGFSTENNQVSSSPQNLNSGAGGFPLFGVAGNADMNLSAYFSQAFWWFVGVVVSISFLTWILSFVSGFGGFGGLVKKLKEGGATGKSIDFDRLTNLVYDAIDTYGTWTEKDIKTGQVGAKGK